MISCKKETQKIDLVAKPGIIYIQTHSLAFCLLYLLLNCSYFKVLSSVSGVQGAVEKVWQQTSD